jgi:DNA-binding transcriptional LysR family regulator
MPLPPETPDLATLDLLVSVAETGSLGQAARRHGISQPAASLRLSTLERRLGLRLLERSATGSRLTEPGAAVVDWARELLEAAHGLTRSITALRAERSGRLRIAASLTVADHLVPGWLVALHRVAPTLSVALQVGNSDHVADLVRSRAVAVGFVEGPCAPAGLRSRQVGGDTLAVVVPPGHRWARRRRPVAAAELAATPLVLREEGSGTRESFLAALAAAGLAPAPPAVELGSTAAIKAAVAAGEGPGVLSRLAVATEIEAGALVDVPVADLHLRRRFRAVWAGTSAPGGPASTLLAVATGQVRRAQKA